MGLGDRGWTSEAEIRYIDELAMGIHSRNLAPSQLLKNYIKSAKQRIENKTFDRVDGYVMIHYAEEKLKGMKRAV